MDRKQFLKASAIGAAAVVLGKGAADAEQVSTGDIVIMTLREGYEWEDLHSVKEEIIASVPQLQGRLLILSGADVTVVRP